MRSLDRTSAEVARDLDLTESALREWVRQADIDDGCRGGLTTAERPSGAAKAERLHISAEAAPHTSPSIPSPTPPWPRPWPTTIRSSK